MDLSIFDQPHPSPGIEPTPTTATTNGNDEKKESHARLQPPSSIQLESNDRRRSTSVTAPPVIHTHPHPPPHAAVASSSSTHSFSTSRPAAPPRLASPPAFDFALASIIEVERILDTNCTCGLIHKEATEKLKKNGPNELKSHTRPPLWKVFLSNFSNAYVLLLLCAAIITLGLGDWAEGIAIIIAVLLTACLSTFTEKSSGDALAELLDMTSPQSTVRRRVETADQEALKSIIVNDLESDMASYACEDEGTTVVNMLIPTRDIVVGDIVVLEGGNVVPADMRLVSSVEFLVDESMLTGEGKEVTKNAAWKPIDAVAALLDLSPPNMVFSGTNVSTGRAVGMVTAVGMNTRIGLIARLILNGDKAAGEVNPETQPLVQPAATSDPTDSADRLQTAFVSTDPDQQRLRKAVEYLQHDLQRDVPSAHPHSLVKASVMTIGMEQGKQMQAELAEELMKIRKMESRKKKRRGSIAKNREKLLQLKPAKKSTPTGPPKRTQTALQTSLSHLGSSLTLLSVVACCALFIIGVSREFKDPAHRDDPAWLHCLLTSLALAVSAIPECLPLAVTICLAMGGTRLTKAKILVRQLPAIENIGMVTVVCSDKTGTITQGEMTATHLYTQGRIWKFSRIEGYNPVGTLTCDGHDIEQMTSEDQAGPLLATVVAGVFCCNTVLEEDELGEEGKPMKFSVRGNMTEAALVVAAMKLGFPDREQTLSTFPKLAEVPFNSSRKLMATLHANTINGGTTEAPSASVLAAFSSPSLDHKSLRSINTPIDLSHGASKVALSSIMFHLEEDAHEAHQADVKQQLLQFVPAPQPIQVEPNMATLAKTIGQPYLAAIKGATPIVLNLCSHILAPDGSVQPLTAELRADMMSVSDSLSQQALRVLSVAYKPFDTRPLFEVHQYDLDAQLQMFTQGAIYVGMIGSADPPRVGIKGAIEAAAQAGIKTVMITGDSLLTAVALAKSVGLIPLGADAVGGLARHAKDLHLPATNAYVSDTQIDDIVDSAVCFARATPEDRLQIVKSLQRLGHVVAMTGRGVNDAAALHAADVGMGMGTGTAVAQQASNMVIGDDDFSTIVTAIKHGRAIYANIQKYVLYMFGSSVVQLLIILTAVCSGFVIPLTPIAILFLNLMSSIFMSYSLSQEHGEEELMSMPPRRANQPILHGLRMLMLIGHTFTLTVCLLINYLVGLWWFTGHVLIQDLHVDDGLSPSDSWNNCHELVHLDVWSRFPLTHDQCVDGVARARTMLFIVLCLSEIGRGFTVRTWLRPFWFNLDENKTMIGVSALAWGLTLFFILTPGLRQIFGLTNSLPYFGWLVAIASAIFIALVDEVIKAVFKAKSVSKQRWISMQTTFAQIMGELRSVNHRLGSVEREMQLIKDNVKAVTTGSNGITPPQLLHSTSTPAPQIIRPTPSAFQSPA